MQSKQGGTLSFIGLSEGHINLTAGTFNDVTTFHCVAAGSLMIKYNNSSSTRLDTQAFLAGDSFGIKNVETVKIEAGTFHIGFD